MATSFAFTPLDGMEMFNGPIRSVTQYEAMLAEKFGTYVEQIPRKLRQERFAEDGAIVERDRFDPDGSLVERAVYGYDSDKRLNYRRHYDQQGQSTALYMYTYDTRGRPVEMSGYNSEGQLLRHVARQYGPDGRLAGMTETRDTRKTVWTVRRGGRGTIAASIGEISENAEPAGRIEIVYDGFGNPRNGSRLNRSGIAEAQWRYAYDQGRDRGNWTRRTLETAVEKFGQHFYEPTKVLLRQFSYFG